MHNVVVTGGSRGLGLCIAEALALSGFQVIAIARREGEQLPAARDRVAAAGRGALHFQAYDLADIEGVSGLVKDLRAEFGILYGLVNNAAVGDASLLSNMSNCAIERLMRINVTSPIVLTKYVLRSMMAGRGGRVVNVSSIVSAVGYSGLSAYGASKSALVGFTRSLAREVGPLGITVNAVAPGFIHTEMTHGMDAAALGKVARRSALRRMPEPVDVSNAVDFLFSEKARNITGTVTTVDAGNTA